MAQDLWQVQLQVLKSPENPEVIFPKEFRKLDTLQIPSLVQKRLTTLYELGYLSSTYKLIQSDSSSLEISFYAGELFRIIQLGQGNVSDEIMNEVGFRPLIFKDKPFSQTQLVKLLNAILDYAENHGYPFAAVKLDSINIAKAGLSAVLNYQSGPKILFDSLHLEGYDKVKTKYLMTHLGIYSGKPYEEKIITEIPNKVKLLSFISLAREPEVTIAQGKCTVKLKLQQQKVSQIDGIVGILPNQQEGEKLLVTGQVLLDLHNLFTSGKRLSFEWQSFDAQSQFLDMMYYHPNLFKTPINIQGKFNLLKQDTSFLNRSLSLELSMLTRNSSQVGFITDFFSSRIISSYGLDEATELPKNNDFNLNYYGVNYKLNSLNNINNPTRGLSLQFSGSVGQKKILKNPAIADSVYRDLDMNSLQIKLDGSIDKFWPLNQFLTFRTRIMGGHIQGDNLFTGDLYRLGGLNSLRGFAEKSIFASSYGILNLELRAYLSSDTYFMLLFDQSAIQNKVDQNTDIELPFGAGIGLSFNTNSGIFNFALALGKSETQPFAFNYAKIHFGYVARF